MKLNRVKYEMRRASPDLDFPDEGMIALARSCARGMKAEA